MAPYWGDFYSIQELISTDVGNIVCEEMDNRQEKRNVYSLSGQFIKTINVDQQLNDILPSGIYIVGGKKMIVR